MCDYSLHAVPNRLAVEGETLITHRFQTYTIGLASAAEIESPSRANREPEISRSWWASFKNWLNPPPPDTNFGLLVISRIAGRFPVVGSTWGSAMRPVCDSGTKNPVEVIHSGNKIRSETN